MHHPEHHQHIGPDAACCAAAAIVSCDACRCGIAAAFTSPLRRLAGLLAGRRSCRAGGIHRGIAGQLVVAPA
jgi:hypothetical protein